MWLEMKSKAPCLPSFKSFSYYCVTVDIHCAANCAAPLAVVRMSSVGAILAPRLIFKVTKQNDKPWGPEWCWSFLFSMDRSVALAKRPQLWRREKSLVPAKEDYSSKTFFTF